MNKCVYCSKEMGVFETKFVSLIHAHRFVCEDCVWKEDSLWFTSKYIDECPDFTDEIETDLKYLFK
ncbi:MAG: hypothetical protein KKH98_09665 [Spirochaetes bacterium]|nr:hypothetical protein [Spirochaetota bacterium]